MTQTSHMTSRAGRNWLPAGLTALLVAAVLAGALLTTGFSAKQDRTAGSGIAAVVPADADTFVVAPYAPEWVDRVSAMADPAMGMPQVRPDPELPVTAIGYSHSEDHETRKAQVSKAQLRLLYFETASPADAASVADSLLELPNTSARRVHVVDRTVVMAANWVESYEAPAEPLSELPGFDYNPGPGESFMWLNPEREVDSLTGHRPEKDQEMYGSVLRRAFGFTEGTTWSGTSSDGTTWRGQFIAGGVDPALIDFAGLYSDLEKTQKVLATAGGDGWDISAAAPGMFNLLSNSSFASPSGTTGTYVADGKFPLVDNALVNAAVEVDGWRDAATDVVALIENVESKFYSANEEEMFVSISYAHHQEP